ncbi:hypothetical protein [Hominifimenecus sp. rT4P-3]|uniref:hypothetical protein n=1 Tax=Hominifimenecus sp. rT4P-3 TaxID=3242979 RepID=UPI003DA3C2F9
MSDFLRKSENRPYFEGWYLKHQNEDQSIAFIPSFHQGADGKKTAFLQMITEKKSWRLRFSNAEFHRGRKSFYARMDGVECTEKGCQFQLRENGIWLEGKLTYSSLTPLKWDIMGPFQFAPGLPCRHQVFSLTHRVDGRLSLNGREYVFRNGTGYVEGDRGDSFPEAYLWTQYLDKNLSIMASAAKIPVGKKSFIGCIGVIWIKGKEYRLGTYLGARVIYADAKKLIIRQGNALFSAECMENSPQALCAPRQGMMRRVIYENLACQVHYQFIKDGKTLLDFTERRASFEMDGNLYES